MPRKVSTQTCLRLELKSLLERYPVRNQRNIANMILAEDLARCLEAFDQKQKHKIGDPYNVPAPPPQADPGF